MSGAGWWLVDAWPGWLLAAGCVAGAVVAWRNDRAAELEELEGGEV